MADAVLGVGKMLRKLSSECSASVSTPEKTGKYTTGVMRVGVLMFDAATAFGRQGMFQLHSVIQIAHIHVSLPNNPNPSQHMR